MINLFTIILISIIFYLIFLLYYLYISIFNHLPNNCNNIYRFNYKYYKNIKHKIKSGDLILFDPYYSPPIVRFNDNIYFQHIALIIKENNNLYCLEINGDIEINNNTFSNAIKTELYTRMKNYYGYIYISHLSKPLTLEQENKLQNINYKNGKILPYIGYLLTHVHGIDLKEYNYFSCMSFVYFILKEINIIHEQKKMNELCNYFNNLVFNNELYKYPYEILDKNLLITKPNSDPILYLYD